MEPESSMPHSQGLSNNPYPEPNQINFLALKPFPLRFILILCSHLRLDLPKGVPVKMLKAPSIYDIYISTFVYNIFMALI